MIKRKINTKASNQSLANHLCLNFMRLFGNFERMQEILNLNLQPEKLLAFASICLVIISKWPQLSLVVLVNRELSDGSVNWPRVGRRNLPKYPVMIHSQNEKRAEYCALTVRRCS